MSVKDTDLGYRAALAAFGASHGLELLVGTDVEHAAPLEAEYAFLRDAIDSEGAFFSLDAILDSILSGEVVDLEPLAEQAVSAIRDRIEELGLVDTEELLVSIGVLD